MTTKLKSDEACKKPRSTLPVGISLLCLLGALLSVVALQVLIEPQPASFTVFFILYLSSLWIGATLDKSGDILSPYFSGLVMYSLYICSALMSVVIGSPGSFQESTVHTYYLAALTGLWGLIFGFRWGYRNSKQGLLRVISYRQIIVNDNRFGRLLILASLAIISILLVNYEQLWTIVTPTAYTSIASEKRVAMAADTWGGIRSYFNTVLSSMLIATSIFWGIRKRSTAIRTTIGSLLVIFLLYRVMVGDKGGVLYFSFLLLSYFHYRVRSVKLHHLLLPALLLYTFATMLNHVRYTTHIPTMASAAIELISENPTILLPSNSGELSGPPKTLLVIIDAVDKGDLKISWGRTLISELLTWIPRSVFPNRPLPLSQEYMYIFYWDDLEEGKGHGFFIPTEGYWAFGIPGVFILMAGFGASLALLYRFYSVNRSSDALFLLYTLAVFTLAFTGIRTGLIGSLRGTLMVIAPLFIPLVLSVREVRLTQPHG